MVAYRELSKKWMNRFPLGRVDNHNEYELSFLAQDNTRRMGATSEANQKNCANMPASPPPAEAVANINDWSDDEL